MPIISPKIPSGLEELMRGLAKSVIKENPHNIYEFAAEYFENLLKERDGTVDQSYKKFATYKVYKKNKSARLKREKENSNDVNDAPPDNGFKRDDNSPIYGAPKVFHQPDSMEEIVEKRSDKARTSISSESEINASIKQEPSVDIEGAPTQKQSSEDEDVKNMVLDDEMAQAALKIQSTFRGHKARKDVKEIKSTPLEGDIAEDFNEQVEVEVVLKQQTPSEAERVAKSDDNEADGSLVDENQSDEPSVEKKQSVGSEIEDDVAKMVLDDDMEQAAVKIQSTFRGHKTRRDMKKGDDGSEQQTSKESQESAPEIDDDIANLVLDDEMAQAAVKIQSTFRGHKTRREMKQGEPQSSEEPQEEEKDVSAAQDVDDEISGMVLDDEMAQAALKIQSTFRGHKTRKEMKATSVQGADDGEKSSVELEIQKSDDEVTVEDEAIDPNEELTEVVEDEIVSKKLSSEQSVPEPEGTQEESPIEQQIEGESDDTTMPENESDGIAPQALGEPEPETIVEAVSQEEKIVNEADSTAPLEEAVDLDASEGGEEDNENESLAVAEAAVINEPSEELPSAQENTDGEKIEAEEISIETVDAVVEKTPSVEAENVEEETFIAEVASEANETLEADETLNEASGSLDEAVKASDEVMEASGSLDEKRKSLEDAPSSLDETAKAINEAAIAVDEILDGASKALNEALDGDLKSVDEALEGDSQSLNEALTVEDEALKVKDEAFDEVLKVEDEASQVEDESPKTWDEASNEEMQAASEVLDEASEAENEALDEVPQAVEALSGASTTLDEALGESVEIALEKQPTVDNANEILLEVDESMPEGTEDKTNEIKNFSDEQTVVDDLTAGSIVESSANPIESENVIELADNVLRNDIELESFVENENCEDKPHENEPIEAVDAEVNEQEPQEGLSNLPNENENENVDNIETSDDADRIPVEEEICLKKSIGDLEPNQQNIESEIDETLCREGSLNEMEADNAEREAGEEENVDKLPSDDVQYMSLKESVSEHDVTPAESIDDADNKSRDLTDEKSIDGDTTESKQHSLDDEKLPEPSLETATIEPILQAEISPIELMDEVVNERAGAVANELFNSNVDESPEHEVELTRSAEGGENQEAEAIDPKLNEQNPLQEIEVPKAIDLSQESVQRSEDEFEPIRDEILQPEKEESEIPEESQAPMDKNVPTVSMEEKSPSAEGDEQDKLPQPEADEEKSVVQIEDDVADMVLDDEMEDAAIKIQAAFRGHKVRKDKQESSEENIEEKSETVDANVVIDQCSEENQEVEEQEDAEQQDTSADVEEIQESESVDQEQTQEEPHEEETAEEETAVETEENETAEQAEDDPDGTPEEAEAAEEPQNEEDDVANMVLDDEMAQAALKIQSTFRGHKTRKDMKKDEDGEAQTSDEPQEQKDSVQDVDDDIANMVLDDDMEQAALKIQSTFRGHKTRQDMKKNENDDEGDKEDNEEEKKEDESEAPKEEEEEAAQSSSTEKSAKQLQEEEDIANLVMDAEMEQTALKIQSAFRGKSRKPKASKDGDESSASSAGDQSDDESPEDENPFQPNENLEAESTGERFYDDEKVSDYSAANYSRSEDNNYSIERYNSYEYEPMALNTSNDDINLMQGGGIFPEPSGESSEMLTGSSGEDKDPDRNSSYEKIPSGQSSVVADEPITEQKAVDPLNDKDVIEKFDFVANKDTAEAMYYSLKKNELETQKQISTERQLAAVEEAQQTEASLNLENQSYEEIDEEEEEEEEDDDDVVVGVRQPLPTSAKRLKYGMSMDDRLLGSILSQDYSTKVRKDGYPDDGFDPLLEATMRNHHFLEKLHEMSNSDEDKPMSYHDFPDGVGDEDQFDDFYNSNSIRQKMMASSFSVADSDYFDPTNNKSIIDDDTIRTALETIHSTDSESTIASAATKIQAGERLSARRNNHITTHSMQYSSIGNAAIDRSLDEFIQSQELRIERFDEEGEGYYSPPPRKQESAEDWTDDTNTYTDSDKKIGGIIDIKLEQKSFLTVDERRRTLHREDAIQRNSTREDEDSSKSSNASGEKALQDKNSAPVEAAIAPQDSVTDTEIAVPVLDLAVKSRSTSLAKPQRMKRQHTMPVQIQTDVIRVVPKHLRKRIKSADGEKKKRVSK